MSKEQRQISLTYTVGGECLVRPGNYTSAKVDIKHAGTDKEIVTILKPSQEISAPIYKKAMNTVTLSSAFVEEALKEPTKPGFMSIERWLKSYRGQMSRKWKTLTDLQKIEVSVSKYVSDMGGKEFSFLLS